MRTCKHRTLLSSRPPLAPPGSKSQHLSLGPGGGGGGAPSKGSVLGPMGGAGPSTPSGSHSLGEGQLLPDPTVPLPAPKEAGDRGRAQARQAAGASDVRIGNAFPREAWKPPAWPLGAHFSGWVSGGCGRECLRGGGGARARCDRPGSSWAPALWAPCAVTPGAPRSCTPRWSSAPRTQAVHAHTHQPRVLWFPLVSYPFYQISNLIKFSQWAHP